MQTGDILRIIMIVAGAGILLTTIVSLAKRQLKEQFAIVWGVISVLLVVAGIALRPTIWSAYFSPLGTAIVMIIGALVLWFCYFISIQISILSRKNQELAMQVSLLNQENERILYKIEKLSKMFDENDE